MTISGQLLRPAQPILEQGGRSLGLVPAGQPEVGRERAVEQIEGDPGGNHSQQPAHADSHQRTPHADTDKSADQKVPVPSSR